MLKTKHLFLKAALLLLAMVLLSVTLISCNGNEEPHPEDTTAAETEPPVNLVDFFDGSPEEYVVIYPDGSGNTVKNAAKSLAMTLEDVYGISIKYRTDKKVDAAESPKEILVGDTNRPESAAAKPQNADNDDFVIRLEGTRLVLVGGSYDGTARAANYLIDHYILGKDHTTLMIDEDMNVNWKYKEECAALFDVASNYTVIYGDLASSGERKLARNLATALSELTGSNMKAKSDMVEGVSNKETAYKTDALEILVGVTNRAESNEGVELDYMDYEVRLTDTKVVLRGGSIEALQRAALSFQISLDTGEISNPTDSSKNELSVFFDTYGKGSMIEEFDSFTPVWASTYTTPSWMLNLEEKVYAVTAMNGRNMSASAGGDSVNYPAYSAQAIASAIKAGVDVIELNLQVSRDGVMMVFPVTELSVLTNADDRAGVSGNPVSTQIQDWTYAELTGLRYKDSKGNVTDCELLTLYEAVALCANRCLVRVVLPESDYDLETVMYDILEENNAFLSYFNPDPLQYTVPTSKTFSALQKWHFDNPNNEALTKAWETYKNNLAEDNHYMRKLFDDNLPESETRWQQLREEWKTFLYTDDVLTYCKYIAANYPSALENDETLTSNNEYTLKEIELVGRVMVFSDPHYYPANNLLGENKDGNKNSENQFAQMEARLRIIVDMIKAEYNGRGLDAVLILGDVSTDNYNTDPQYSSTWTYYCKEFYDKLMAEMPEGLPVYALPGNHDSFSNDTWNDIFGTDRQFAVTVGDKVFLMLDTFGDNGVNVVGADYKGVDMDWVDEQVKKYADKEIILCAHHMTPGEYKTIAAKYSNVRCFFQGHTHQYNVTALDSGAYYIDEGGFSYTAFSDETGSSWNFGYLDLRSAWGYQIVEWSEDTMTTYHVFIAHEYYATNMHYNLTENIKTTDVVLSKKES